MYKTGCLIVVSLILLGLFSCKYGDKISSGSRNTIIEIEATSFRELFNHNGSGIKDKASYYYIKINGPTYTTINSVIKSLRDVKPEVKNLKRYICLNQAEKNKINFLSFTINKIEFNELKDTAYVDCGYYEDNLSSSGNVISLIREENKWIVIKNRMLWISSNFQSTPITTSTCFLFHNPDNK